MTLSLLSLLASRVPLSLDDIRRMVDANETPVLGIQLGVENPKYFTEEDLQLRVQTLCLEIEQAAFEKQSVCFQYLIKWNWRYFTVLKFYQLHYTTRGKTGSKHFCLSDPLTFYQTIFPTAEKFGPNQMAHEREREKMKRVNCTCTCWRMLHSAAAQIEYVVHRLQVLHCLIAILVDQCTDIKLDQWMELFHHKQKISDKNLKMASFCVSTILQTTGTLCKKLKSVLTSHVVMIGKTLTSVILRKMDTVLQQDPNTGLYFPKQDEKALEGVKEIMVMLQFIRDALSEDAHKACKTMVI